MLKSNIEQEWDILGNSRLMLILFTLFSLFFLWHISTYPLMEPDEGRYAQIPMEMLQSGNFLTPYLHNLLYFEKPILGYWLNATMLWLFGANEFAARLATALYALGGIYGIYYLGRRLFNTTVGALAGIITATSTLYYIIGSINILDMGLSFWYELVIISCSLFIKTSKRQYLYLFYIAIALGTLTKGLIAIVLACGVIGLYVLWTWNWTIIRKFLYLPAILVFILIVSPWFILVSKANPSFAYFFFIHEHFMRYLYPIHDHNEPFYYLWIILIIGLFPWTGYALANCKYRDLTKLCSFTKIAEHTKLLLIAASWPMLFFSFSSSQLAPYIVPVIPFCSLLIAKQIYTNVRSNCQYLIAWSINFILTITIIIGGYLYSQSFQEGLLQRELILLASNLLIGNLLMLLVFRKNYRQAIAINIIMAILFVASLQPIFAEVATRRSTAYLAPILNSPHYREAQLVNYKDYTETLTFYTHKLPLICNYYGELAFGAIQEPEKPYFINAEELVARWTTNEHLVIIANAKYTAELRDILPDNTYSIHDEGKFIIIEHN